MKPNFALCLIFFASLLFACKHENRKSSLDESDHPDRILNNSIFELTGGIDPPVITKGDPGTEGNTFGFEGGKVLKINKEYHIFTTEMWGEPVWCKTRLAHWKSKDGISWKREATLFESSGDFTGSDSHACLWSPMPTFDKINKNWVLTYVCYRSKPNTSDKWYRNYDGIIALAVSDVKGKEGIGGPFTEKAIIMESDTVEPKLGLMGVDSFYPYQADGQWYAFYGSSPEWNGLAGSPSLLGPWKRISEAGVVSRHTENPVVSRLPDGRYIAFFDGCGFFGGCNDICNSLFHTVQILICRVVLVSRNAGTCHRAGTGWRAGNG